MKFTILENAINSLDIAVEHFKYFYRGSDFVFEDYKEKADIKISLVFLENAIELLLKSIFLQNAKNNFKIFLNTHKEPYKSIIEEAKKRSKITGDKIEDCLIGNTNLKTIPYGKTVTYYCEDYCKSKKVEGILRKLGEYRNAITHFGVDFSDSPDNLVCCFIESFDVIYNYLYPDLLLLDEKANYYFADDNIFLRTPNGYKFFVDDTDEYTGFLDFVDELLTECSQTVIMDLCCENSKRNIKPFINACNEIQTIEKYNKYFNENNLKIEIYEETDWISIDGIDNDIHFYPYYSSYYNATVFLENENVVFIVVHSDNTIYKYIKQIQYSYGNSKEDDERWLYDLEMGYCERLELSVANIFLSIRNWYDRLYK